MLIREIKIPHYAMRISYATCLITSYASLNDDTITSYVVCCAKCHFLPFLPFSSRTMPRSWKFLAVTKTPTNSSLWAYYDKIGMIPIMTVKSTLVNLKIQFLPWKSIA